MVYGFGVQLTPRLQVLARYVFSGFWSTILEYFLFGTCSFKEIKVYTFFSLVTSKPSFGLKEYHTVPQAWPKAPSQANKSDAPRYG